MDRSRKIEPATYITSNGYRVLSLGEVAEVSGKCPKQLWTELFEIFKDVRLFTVSVACNETKEVSVLLDREGNVSFFNHSDEIEKAKFNVGGDEIYQLGDWQHVYLADKFALPLLDKYRPTMHLRSRLRDSRV